MGVLPAGPGVRAAVIELLKAPPRRAAGRASVDDLASVVPSPAARYLRKALGDAPPLVRVARPSQEGVLRPGVRSSRWLPFSAEQVVAPLATAFVWDARVRIAPLDLHRSEAVTEVDSEHAHRVALSARGHHERPRVRPQRQT